MKIFEEEDLHPRYADAHHTNNRQEQTQVVPSRDLATNNTHKTKTGGGEEPTALQ